MFAIIGLAFLFVFSYLPMFGIIIAFKEYKVSSGVSGIFTSEFVGLKYFIEFLRITVLGNWSAIHWSSAR